MSSRTALPTPLMPYLRLPPELSQILLTSTLGTSTTWLVSRFIGAIVGSKPPNESEVGSEENHAAVVLVSWLRDEAFWRTEIRRGTGLDLANLSSKGQFAFLDAMALLATTSNKSDTTASVIPTLETSIAAAIHRLSNDHQQKILLILDAPDTLLATSAVPSSTLSTLLLTLRSKVHSTILNLSSDIPLISAAAPSLSHGRGHAPSTPLETDTATFLVQQAHASRFVMGVRELETGAAKDVSGVLRVSRGGDAGWDGEGEGEEKGSEDMEALFLVLRDGGAKVFERGE